MDLLTLLSVCSLGFDHKLLHGIAIVQSEGRPYVYKSGEQIVSFDTPEAVIKASRQEQEKGRAIRIGLMGADIDLLSGTAEPNAAMFEPCINVNIASRQLDGYLQMCKREGSSSPETCAVASYMGDGYRKQDEHHLDFIMTGGVTSNLPNPEINGSERPARPPREEEDPAATGSIFFDDPANPRALPARQNPVKDSVFFE